VLTKPARSAALRKAICEALGRPLHASPSTSQAEPTAAAAPREASAGTMPAQGTADRTLDVLIAEDNEVNQLVFRQILQNSGRRFAIVPTGREAVALWLQSRPALILMDVSMPEMNGLEATQAIRQSETEGDLPRTPIIGLTAHALEGDRERCLEAGMDDHLTKPISPARLEAKIAAWLPEREFVPE
jgi:CheY-like chemotaxis protein